MEKKYNTRSPGEYNLLLLVIRLVFVCFVVATFIAMEISHNTRKHKPPSLRFRRHRHIQNLCKNVKANRHVCIYEYIIY